MNTRPNRKNRLALFAFALIGLFALFVFLKTLPTPTVPPRSVRLVVTGPAGQRFSGSYIADGVTNIFSATTPTNLSIQARNVAYEFKREGGDGEFRVALYVGDLCRTSATSDKRQGVHGQLQYAPGRESYWAGPF